MLENSNFHFGGWGGIYSCRRRRNIFGGGGEIYLEEEAKYILVGGGKIYLEEDGKYIWRGRGNIFHFIVIQKLSSSIGVELVDSSQ